MSPNGRRAWRAAAKKLRRKHGLRSASISCFAASNEDEKQENITGAWFKRHGFTMDDPRYKIRQYIGTWGTVDGDGVEFAIKPVPFTPRSLVGMTQGARKRAALVDYVSDRPLSQCLPSQRREYTALAKAAMQGMGVPSGQPRRDPYYKKTCLAKYRIGQKLRPCAGCIRCECQTAFDVWPKLGEALAKDHPTCDGSGVLPARGA